MNGGMSVAYLLRTGEGLRDLGTEYLICALDRKKHEFRTHETELPSSLYTTLLGPKIQRDYHSMDNFFQFLMNNRLGYLVLYDAVEYKTYSPVTKVYAVTRHITQSQHLSMCISLSNLNNKADNLHFRRV